MRHGAHTLPVHRVSSHCLPPSLLRERRNLHSLSDLSLGGRGNCKDKVPAAALSPASFAQEPSGISQISPRYAPPHLQPPPASLPHPPPPLIRDLTMPTSTERLERERDEDLRCLCWRADISQGVRRSAQPRISAQRRRSMS